MNHFSNFKGYFYIFIKNKYILLYINNLICIYGGNFNHLRDSSELQIIDLRQLNRSLPSVEIGEKIEFSKAARGTYFLLGIDMASRLGIGWYYPENWGTWAAADKATLLIPKPTGVKPKTLTLEMNALVSPKHPIQRIEIRVGGGPTQNFALSKPVGNIIALDLSQQKRPTNYVEIEIRSLDRIAPKAIGIGQDERLLGFGLISAYFDK